MAQVEEDLSFPPLVVGSLKAKGLVEISHRLIWFLLCRLHVLNIRKVTAKKYTKKIERFFAKKGVLFYRVLGLNTLCKGCSSHTTFVRLLYPRGDKLEKVCTGYKV